MKGYQSKCSFRGFAFWKRHCGHTWLKKGNPLSLEQLLIRGISNKKKSKMPRIGAFKGLSSRNTRNYWKRRQEHFNIHLEAVLFKSKSIRRFYFWNNCWCIDIFRSFQKSKHRRIFTKLLQKKKNWEHCILNENEEYESHMLWAWRFKSILQSVRLGRQFYLLWVLRYRMELACLRVRSNEDL